MRRSITFAILIASAFLLFVAATGCTPEEVTAFKSLPPQAQADVIKWLQDSQRPTGCVEAMRRVWPQSEWAWGERIMWRESNHTPSARNRSGASGCWQMMLPLHNRRFAAVGCSPAEWADPLCNNKAAYNLFVEAGRSPWVLTNW
jgi:hypothetical protein